MHRKTVIKSLVFAFFLAAIPILYPGLARAEPSNFLGTNILWDNGDPVKLDSSFRRMKALGMKNARVDWEWRVVESQKGSYDWTALDRLVSLAHENGVNLLPIVHYAPDWALVSGQKPEGTYQMAPRRDAFQAYADFVAASVRRYGPGGDAPVAFTPITAWQTWNEPNGKEFWGPAPDPAAFAELMETTARTLAFARSRIKIVHAGLSKADHVFLWSAWEADKNYGRTFDILAVHPYFFNPRGGVRSPDAMDKDRADVAALGFVGNPDDVGYLGKVFNLQLFLTLKGTPKPIWITEIGFMAGSGNPWAVSERTQTDLARDTLAYIMSRLTDRPFEIGKRADLAANVQRVYWFTLDDYGFPNDTGNFGLYRMNGTIRPFTESVIKPFLSGGGEP
ncbi:MAG: beta-galactosidase [Rhodospirillales bacterium]|nr:beta-galactosidase [Rhodospirillales bacterium]